MGLMALRACRIPEKPQNQDIEIVKAQRDSCSIGIKTLLDQSISMEASKSSYM